MELTESIESINQQLKDIFGIDTVTGLPIWRVAWSEDQFENRLGTYDDFSPAGIYLRTVTEVRKVPKYRQWITKKYVLERLCVVPIINEKDLPDKKTSYEPLHAFEDKYGNYLPPKFNACQFIINLVYAVQYGVKITRYADPNVSQEAQLQLQKERVDKLQEELFGDELGDIGLDLLNGQAVSVPSNYGDKN